MKITALVSLAAAVMVLAEASPIKQHPGHVVELTRNPHHKKNTLGQMRKMYHRYNRSGTRNLAAGLTGTVGLTNYNGDVEYYGTVSVGTPAQKFKLDFDTGSSDIWFPSSTCNTTACKKHTRFNSAKSSTYKKDGRPWKIGYGDGSTASGTLGSDIVNVGGISVRQTIGLATAESSQFGSGPSDGLFGLAFNTIESVSGVQTWMDSAIAAGTLAQPVVSVFLPSVRRNGGVGGQYLFGGIDSTKYTGSLTYIPVDQKGWWQIKMDDVLFNGKSLGFNQEGIVDTGTTLVLLSDDAAAAVHKSIPGAVFHPAQGQDPSYYSVPCSAKTGNVGFSLGGTVFNVPMADVAYEDLGDGSGNCYSGIQGGMNWADGNPWILGDVFIKNNYCVFDQGQARIGIAPLKY
ncbi:1,3-beta-glucanosyltransferase [Gryganskiella cystojenkinii]|nr:1,3-beta-glucanosyltransferase [Gryganskiella cystojenkinii]